MFFKHGCLLSIMSQFLSYCSTLFMVETQLWIRHYFDSINGEPRANPERASFRTKGGDKDQVTLLHFPALQDLICP